MGENRDVDLQAYKRSVQQRAAVALGLLSR
jgi:hypothetical protein